MRFKKKKIFLCRILKFVTASQSIEFVHISRTALDLETMQFAMATGCITAPLQRHSDVGAAIQRTQPTARRNKIFILRLRAKRIFICLFVSRERKRLRLWGKRANVTRLLRVCVTDDRFGVSKENRQYDFFFFLQLTKANLQWLRSFPRALL